MQTMVRETWTDERLDHLSERMDECFRRSDERIDHLTERMEEGFRQTDERFNRLEQSIDRRFDKVDDRFASFEAEFKALNRTLIQGAWGLVGTMIVTCGAVVATQL